MTTNVGSYLNSIILVKNLRGQPEKATFQVMTIKVVGVSTLYSLLLSLTCLSIILAVELDDLV